MIDSDVEFHSNITFSSKYHIFKLYIEREKQTYAKLSCKLQVF